MARWASRASATLPSRSGYAASCCCGREPGVAAARGAMVAPDAYGTSTKDLRQIVTVKPGLVIRLATQLATGPPVGHIG
jgi:hypothetical protein